MTRTGSEDGFWEIDTVLFTDCRAERANLRVQREPAISRSRTELCTAFTLPGRRASRKEPDLGRESRVEGHTEPVTLAVDTTRSVSGLWRQPPKARARFVLAHGAGAGMTHPFLEAIADGLADRGGASLRYQFPFMEQGSRRPDPPKLAHATVRAAVAEAGRLAPDLPLVAGGKSFGGRMTSQAQAASHLPGVRGLAFLGFPLHPAGKPSSERAQHLFEIDMPMHFLQG